MLELKLSHQVDVCVCGQNVSVCLLVRDESAVKHLKNASSLKNALIWHLPILYTCIYMCVYICVCVWYNSSTFIKHQKCMTSRTHKYISSFQWICHLKLIYFIQTLSVSISITLSKCASAPVSVRWGDWNKIFLKPIFQL